MSTIIEQHIELHGRKYRLPQRPTVVICVDGFDPEYLDQGIADGILPNMESYVKSGFSATAKCAMPSFTNPNNVSIVTGVPTAIHGISGNFYLDRETGLEHMITDASLLRGSTILAEMSARGVRVAAITAKDKVRGFICHGLSLANQDFCFSAEKVKDCSLERNGIENVEKLVGRPAPAQYSGDLSLFVLDAGIKLLEKNLAELFYLTLSDYVQHKYAPGSEEANAFMSELDTRIGRLVELGAVVAITADHGMSDKTNPDGTPNVLYLEDELERKYGPDFARVICPITDPFVRHHGALGSFVRVHLKRRTQKVEGIVAFCRTLPQVQLAMDGVKAAAEYEMPVDREGDVVVIAKKGAVIGSRQAEHDLSNLEGHKLRSHGGLSEQPIPLLGSVAVGGADAPREWRNFDAFDIALNY